MQNKRKHILFLSSWYPSRILSDNGDFIQRHAQAVALKHDVTVVHAIKDPLLKTAKFKVEQNYHKGVNEIIVYCKPALFKPFNLVYILQAFLEGIKLVKPFKVIHLNVVYPAGLIAVYLKYKYKLPVILTEHWTHLHQNKFNKLPKYKQFAIKKILNAIDLALPVSDHLGKSLQKINAKVNYQVIPNVVSLQLFRPKSISTSGKKRFLHLSHLGDEHKNITGMLNVAKQLAENGYLFEFYIGGNTNLNGIKSFINQHQLTDFVFPFGKINHCDVNQEMKKSDCFVLFSRFENQPCVQAEAFASGIPIIATNVGGVNEFLPQDFGILIDSENEEQLYQAMKEVIEGKVFATANQLSEYAKAQFSEESIANQYHQIYNQFLK